MTYTGLAKDILESVGGREGDTVSVLKHGTEYRGILMPHHEFSDPSVVIVKLGSGYNAGIRLGEGVDVSVVSRPEARAKASHPPVHDDGLADVAVIGTGGTIASYVDYRTGAVHPALSTDDLVRTVPEISEICNIHAEVLFSIFSENMDVQAWQTLAGRVADRLNEGMDGVVVPHGTDTLGYTSAALSFMMEGVNRPVVLVGAQRSSDRPSSDAYSNLMASAHLIDDGRFAGVFALMHEGSSDTSFALHRGTRVRKMHTSRRDAFHSINSPPEAVVDDEGGLRDVMTTGDRSSSLTLMDDMEADVRLVHFHPGMSPATFRDTLRSNRGVVIAGTGLGHVSRPLIPEIASAIEEGTTVVMTSQCINGRVNLNVYDTGRDLISAGVIPGEDMIPETAFVKLMWVLANAKGDDDVRGMMLSNLRGEIEQRREILE